MEQVLLKTWEWPEEIRNTRQLTLDEAAELAGDSGPVPGQIGCGCSWQCGRAYKCRTGEVFRIYKMGGCL